MLFKQWAEIGENQNVTRFRRNYNCRALTGINSSILPILLINLNVHIFTWNYANK